MIIVTCCSEEFELRARLQIRSKTETVRAKNQVLEMTFSPPASSHRLTRVPFHKNAESSSLFGLGCLIKNTDDRIGEAVGLMFCFNTLKTWTGGSPTLDWFGKNCPLTCIKCRQSYKSNFSQFGFAGGYETDPQCSLRWMKPAELRDCDH